MLSGINAAPVVLDQSTKHVGMLLFLVEVQTLLFDFPRFCSWWKRRAVMFENCKLRQLIREQMPLDPIQLTLWIGRQRLDLLHDRGNRRNALLHQLKRCIDDLRPDILFADVGVSHEAH
jgi:hypothetical protein